MPARVSQTAYVSAPTLRTVIPHSSASGLTNDITAKSAAATGG
jgi:hypothetical protein